MHDTTYYVQVLIYGSAAHLYTAIQHHYHQHPADQYWRIAFELESSHAKYRGVHSIMLYFGVTLGHAADIRLHQDLDSTQQITRRYSQQQPY